MIHMKILIAPLITAARADAAYLITRTLSDLLSYRQNAVAVSTAKASSISSAALYEAAVLKKPRFAAAGLSSYEEWLYSAGAVSEDYLKKDTECLLNAIDHFHPDVIIVIDRIAGVIAARIRGIPCVPLISSSMYRNSSFPARGYQSGISGPTPSPGGDHHAGGSRKQIRHPDYQFQQADSANPRSRLHQVSPVFEKQNEGASGASGREAAGKADSQGAD